MDNLAYQKNNSLSSLGGEGTEKSDDSGAMEQVGWTSEIR